MSTFADFWFTDARGGELAAWWSLIGVTIVLVLLAIGVRVYVAHGRHATNRCADAQPVESVTVPRVDTSGDGRA